jgi:DNA-binding NarL/FixJ family response regulator
MNVLIIDGHPLVHEVLGAVARSVFGDVELRTAKDLEGGLAVSRTEPKPDLVLMDLAPGWAGIEALARFRALFPCVQVVAVSANDSRALIRAAFKAGVIGYLPKTLSPKIMVAALQLIAAGGKYVPYEVLGDDSPPSDKKGNSCLSIPDQLGLTERQTEVLRLILRGYNNRNIARELAIDFLPRHGSAGPPVRRSDSRCAQV